MLRDVLAARWRMLMPRIGIALVFGFVVSQLTLASSAEGAPQTMHRLVLWPNSDPAGSVDDQSHHAPQGRLRSFVRSWTHRHINFRSAERARTKLQFRVCIRVLELFVGECVTGNDNARARPVQ